MIGGGDAPYSLLPTPYSLQGGGYATKGGGCLSAARLCGGSAGRRLLQVRAARQTG